MLKVDALPALRGGGTPVVSNIGVYVVLLADVEGLAAANGFMALVMNPRRELLRERELDPERDMEETARLPSLRLLPVRPLSSSAETDAGCIDPTMSWALRVGDSRPAFE